jgi:hypothetical protein
MNTVKQFWRRRKRVVQRHFLAEQLFVDKWFGNWIPSEAEVADVIELNLRLKLKPNLQQLLLQQIYDISATYVMWARYALRKLYHDTDRLLWWSMRRRAVDLTMDFESIFK